jgi:hypothetical protein
LKKFSVAAAASVGRKISFPPMNRRPVATRSRSPPPSSSSTGGSALRTRPRKNAETRKETASARSANGALKI